MTILEKAAKFYEQIGESLFEEIGRHASLGGYVFIAPDSILLGKAVNSKSDKHPGEQWNVKNPDAWFVTFAYGKGSVQDFIEKIPHPLPLVGWMRELKSKPVKFYDFKRINRRKNK